MSIREVLAENLRSLRQGRGLTQETLAKMAGLSVTFLNKLEAKSMTINLDNLQKIADALDVSIEALVAGKKKSTPESTKVNLLMSDIRQAVEVLQRNLIETEMRGKKAATSKKRKKKS